MGMACIRAEMRQMSGGSQTIHAQDPWPFNGLELQKVECEQPPSFQVEYFAHTTPAQ